MSGTIPVTPDCQHCGACCASFRVSFYWADRDTWQTPEALTEKVGAHFSCMAGTNYANPHCIALQGKVGEQVTCTIYDQRPSPCREVQPGDEQCLKARRRHGLAAASA